MSSLSFPHRNIFIPSEVFFANVSKYIAICVVLRYSYK